MKRLTLIFAAMLGWALAGWSASPAPLASLHAIQALTNDEAAQHPPVAFEATITFYDLNIKSADVQDNDIGIYVKLTKDAAMVPGDRVLVQGTMQPSFLPYVLASDVTLIRHGTLPKPFPATFDDLLSKRVNCRLVTVRGIIRAANLVSTPVAPSGRLELLMDGGYIGLEVESNDLSALKSLLDAEVEVTGASGRIFDGKMQQAGAKIRLSSLADIRVIKPAPTSPWTLPVTPLGEIVTGYHIRDLSQRLRVHGIITYYQPGSAVVLQDGIRSLWVSTETSEPLLVGDAADATGIPDTHDGLLTLTHAEVRDTRVQAPIEPRKATWGELAFWGRSVLGARQYDLVSIDGRLVTEVRGATQDEYVLVADGKEFTAVYRHPPAPSRPPPMLEVPLGSTIQVTGICIPLNGNPFNNEAPFDILLRSFDDIEVVATPTLLTLRNMTIVVVVLLFVLMAIGVRGWTLEHRMRRQTASVAYLERRRRRILEDINGARPLAEIVEQITEMVSFMLHGAPCWCQIADGAMLGNRPPQLTSLRTVELEIPGHSGPALGTISAAFDALTKPKPEESEALSMGAGLAAVAIETSRLYTDLVHRSEFDLLTDIHNRFSLDQRLDELIAQARSRASIFGLVYIDLDDFKQVNDQYGHQVGDMYLQEAALRMKRQLRPGDTLARLGGDEFAVLVPEVHSRAGAQEIALRLTRSFDEPFVLEGYVLHGSASVGVALYPEDADTNDSLLSAADAAMYVAKQTRRQAKAELTG